MGPHTAKNRPIALDLTVHPSGPVSPSQLSTPLWKKDYIISMRRHDQNGRTLTATNVPGKNIKATTVMMCIEEVSLAVLNAIVSMTFVDSCAFSAKIWLT